MIPKNVGNPVFDLTNAGMQEAAEELGDLHRGREPQDLSSAR